jgi:sRNA-binding carbon storage regulator CsrA
MLVLGINKDEDICIGDNIVICFYRGEKGGRWRCCIEAPKEIIITRKKNNRMAKQWMREQ